MASEKVEDLNQPRTARWLLGAYIDRIRLYNPDPGAVANLQALQSLCDAKIVPSDETMNKVLLEVLFLNQTTKLTSEEKRAKIEELAKLINNPESPSN